MLETEARNRTQARAQTALEIAARSTRDLTRLALETCAYAALKLARRLASRSPQDRRDALETARQRARARERVPDRDGDNGRARWVYCRGQGLVRYEMVDLAGGTIRATLQ